jgi:DNA-binding NarL/FixJ family response regulator
MRYRNADEIFPKELLAQIQTYFDGGLVYIPKLDKVRKKWGEKSGSRQFLIRRNQEIQRLFSNGEPIEYLAERFYLSPSSIKKIVYTKTQSFTK